MIKEHLDKVIIIVVFLLFALGLFFSVRFLRSEINSAISSLDAASTISSSQLNMDAWSKIQHRFTQ